MSSRRTARWYRQNDFGAMVACTAPKTMSIPETTSVPVYYAVLGTSWSTAQAASKMEEARSWFESYCINIPIYRVTLKQGEAQF